MKASVLAILLAAASPAFSQDKKDDPFKDCQYGQRVELTLRSGFGVFGKLTPYKKDPMNDESDVPLAVTKTILLDMSLEYPELGGSKDPISGKFVANIVGLERAQVKAVRILPNLSEEEVKARLQARDDALGRILAEDAHRRKLEADIEDQRRKEAEERAKKKRADEAKTLEGQLKQQAERIAKARALYEKFPPEAWGSDKLKEIKNKSVLGQIPTPEESEFIENIELWMFYKAYLENQDKKEPPKDLPKDEPKKEEPKKEEAPK